MTGRWFAAENTAPEAAAQLFCLPHAGAGASAYRDWQDKIGPDVEVVPVQLPGREARFAEPFVTSATEMAAALAGPLLERATGDRPFALFGHSMGALLAYELTHQLIAYGRPPVHLIVSGYAPPHLPYDPAYQIVHQMPDPRLVAHIEALQGTAGEVLDHPELLELLLPVIRADYELCETYRFEDRPPLPVALTALGGADDPEAGEKTLPAWRELTAASFTVDIFPGGHFYLHAHLDEVTGIAREAALSERSRT
ncbi:thioesterase II family protein [Nonomuraea solani]|nr:alpha/beta fold hydrolase [Nonomuraea solani]